MVSTNLCPPDGDSWKVNTPAEWLSPSCICFLSHMIKTMSAVDRKYSEVAGFGKVSLRLRVHPVTVVSKKNELISEVPSAHLTGVD